MKSIHFTSCRDKAWVSFDFSCIFFILQMANGYMVLVFGGAGELKRLVNQVSEGFHAREYSFAKTFETSNH